MFLDPCLFTALEKQKVVIPGRAGLRVLQPRIEIEKTNAWGVWMVDGRRCEGGLSQLARMVRTRSVGGIVLVR